MSAIFTFALPAGRLAEESVEFFQKSNIADFRFPKDGRELFFYDTSGEYRVVLVRSQDVPTYVLQGGADAGITGRDVLTERGYDLTIPLQFPFGACRLSVAAPNGSASALMQKAHLRVATKYPRIATDFFFSKGISCEIIKVHGSVEIAPILGLADCIVDLVSTGSTLKANGLVELDTILHSTAMLLVNRSVYALKTEKISDILKKMRKITDPLMVGA